MLHLETEIFSKGFIKAFNSKLTKQDKEECQFKRSLTWVFTEPL